MSNIQNKPKLTAKQLVTKMKVEKGISFSKFSEKHAEKYLFDINNYLRTASYRKNYQKYRSLLIQMQKKYGIVKFLIILISL